MTEYPFKNLVFQGGGVKGIAYIGAIETLDQAGILEPIQRVAGASVGAITALLVSFRLPVPETVALLNSLDFSKVPGDMQANDSPFIPNFIEKPLDKAGSTIEDLWRLYNHYGWHSSSYIYGWLQDTIAGQCGGNKMATFAEFRQRGFRDLHVVTTNLDRQTAVIFCADTTPNVAVADTVRMSMSVPMFFESLQFDGQKLGSGDHYVDGGTVLNYPITIFDTAQHVSDLTNLVDGVNRETLGCTLFSPPECGPVGKPVTDLRSYFVALFETLLATQIITLQNSPADIRRSIFISNQCVGATDFDIKPDSDIYNKLVAGGVTAVQDFLAKYTP